MDDEKIIIQNDDGTTAEVEVITYLVNEDKSNIYLVYSKGEIEADTSDEIIYVSKVVKDGNILKLSAISDDIEWDNVQKLLKKIANAQ